jgi:hypothetical protein
VIMFETMVFRSFKLNFQLKKIKDTEFKKN